MIRSLQIRIKVIEACAEQTLDQILDLLIRQISLISLAVIL